MRTSAHTYREAHIHTHTPGGLRTRPDEALRCSLTGVTLALFELPVSSERIADIEKSAFFLSVLLLLGLLLLWRLLLLPWILVSVPLT